jgi:outer membrane protein TolC
MKNKRNTSLYMVDFLSSANYLKDYLRPGAITFKAVFLLFMLVIAPYKATYSQSDSTLTISRMFDQVKLFHPVARQALLQPDIANAELFKTKGAFDPVVSTGLDQKQFADKSYYSLLDGGIKWATGIGAVVKSGYEFNRGVFLNPENNTPSNGLLYAGVSMPLGQGLLIDDRRAAIRSARIGTELAEQKKREIFNQLLYNASEHYLEWFRSYHIRSVFNTAFRNANERYRAVVVNSLSGDRPAIDTIEAKIQLQIIEAGLNQSILEFNNSALLFSTFFWDTENKPVGLSPALKPLNINDIALQDNDAFLLTSDTDFRENHPYMLQLRQKLRQLEIDRKLKQDRLKPILNVQFNPLTEPTGDGLLTNLSVNNFKWGLEFRMPLLLRKERGDIRLAEFKIQENQLETENVSISLLNMFDSRTNEWNALREQAEIYAAAADNYERMFNAESRLFEIGESSLFLVNAREQALINARIKYIEVLAKSIKAYYSILYYAGQLADL